MMTRMNVCVACAVFCLGAIAFPGEVLIDDFEDVSDWSVLTLETATAREGLGAGRWADTVNDTSIRKTFAAPLDVASFTHLGFWLHSETANGAELQIVLDSEDAASAGWDYYSSELIIDWSGWRWIWLSKDDLSPARSPLGWHTINYISCNASGWGHTPRADTNLILDRMVFAKAVVSGVACQQAWSLNEYVYTFTLELSEPYGSPLDVDVSCAVPAGLSVSVVPARVVLPASGSASVIVQVTIPESAWSQGAYEISEVIFTVVAGASGREVWREDVANPGPQTPSPRMLLTSSDFTRMNQWAETHAWADSRRNGIISRAQGWPDSFLTRYGLGGVALPPEGGQWGMHYVCPTHGANLAYEAPMTHRCPVDGATFSGWPYDQVIYARQHGDLAGAARDLGLAYGFTGEEAYASAAREILALYGAAYESYAIHDINGTASGSGARVLSQTLDESVWLVEMAWAYDLVAASAGISTGDRSVIEDGLMRPCAEVIKRNDAGLSNWQAWHNAAIAAAGRAIDDPSLVGFAINGRSGFFRHMVDSVLDDGFWYEGSWGYHFYTLSPMTYLAEMGERGGFELYPNPRLKSMYTAPVLFAPPDLVLPAFNDSGEVDLRGSAGWRLEAAYNAYSETDLALPLLGQERDEEALFWGVESLPDDVRGVSESLVFDASGFAVLRGGVSGDPWYLALDYGPHGGWHGHYDKLGFVFFARGQMLGIDPGSHSYALPLHDTWDRSTVGHNTLVVDEADQAEATGALNRFVVLPGCVFARAVSGAAYGQADLARSIAMVDGYVLDRVEARSTDAASHSYDWFYHDPGTLSHDLAAASYSGLPSTGGYQHLANNVAQTTSADALFDFAFPVDADYPGGLWKNDAAVIATTTYSQDQAHGGEWSNRLHYDFTAVSGYVTYRTTSMAAHSTELPTGISAWVFGSNSLNTIRLRIVDATGESHVSSSTTLDFLGWQEVTHDIDVTWSHWSGNDDGVIDLPLSNLVLELNHAAGGALVGDVYLDDWRLTFPTAGEILVEDFERLLASERVWVKGAAGTTLVCGEGIGPDLSVPVPYVLARRDGIDVDFDALHEPHGGTPAVTVFDVLSSSAAAEDCAVGYSVGTDTFSDRVMLVGTGLGGVDREFTDWATDGVVAWARKTSGGEVVRLAVAEGSKVSDASRDLFVSLVSLEKAAFGISAGSVDILTCTGELSGARLYAPATSAVSWGGVPVPFTQDGDCVVFGALPADDDYDGDGMLNGWEISNGLDPTDSSDAALDPDGDGLSNLDEQGAGTDPYALDSDGDMHDDGEEIAAGSDPLDPASTPADVIDLPSSDDNSGCMAVSRLRRTNVWYTHPLILMAWLIAMGSALVARRLRRARERA